MTDTVPTCRWCNQSIALGTPGLIEGGYVCEGCARSDKSGRLITGVNAHSLHPCGVYYMNTGVLHVAPLSVSAWLEGGLRYVPIREVELSILHSEESRSFIGLKSLNEAAAAVLGVISLEDRLGHFRCTDCTRLTEKPIAARPLFAGAICEGCKPKQQAVVEEERRAGKFCSLCGHPISTCCC